MPCDWKKDFEDKYLSKIKYLCLVMSENYIKNNFEKITKYESVIEQRLCSDLKIEEVIKDNAGYHNGCLEYGLNYYLIDKEYNVQNIVNYIIQKG